MGGLVGDRAVVLGGSIAGLLAARTLAEYFSEVVVVDRDELNEVHEPRPGVPHGLHAHGLLARGQEILERLFPGLTEELVAAGVWIGDLSGDVRWYFNGSRLCPARSGLVFMPSTRPVLEYHVRRRVQSMPNVTFLERHDILGLVNSPDRRRVTGARVHSRVVSEEQVLSADLVLDAAGRGSRTPVWLEELGYSRPAEEQVKIGLAYTTRRFRLRTDPFDGDLAIIPVSTPSHPRGAVFYKIPGDGSHVELSLTGILGDRPPRDLEGFLAYAKTLPVPGIYEAIKVAEPLGDPATFLFPASVRRRYERLGRFPEGLLVLGDAACTFNPVYGQGMTSAALQTLTLGRHLRSGSVPHALEFFRDTARDIAAPWDFSAGADLCHPGVRGRRTAKIRMTNAYIRRLQTAVVNDTSVATAFIRAAGLIDPPQALMRPGVVLRALRKSGRRTVT